MTVLSSKKFGFLPILLLLTVIEILDSGVTGNVKMSFRMVLMLKYLTKGSNGMVIKNNYVLKKNSMAQNGYYFNHTIWEITDPVSVVLDIITGA